MPETFGSDLFLIFGQGSGRFALPLAGIDEVLEPSGLGFVPQAPRTCLGVIVRNGQVIAVLDSGGLLAAEGPPDMGNGAEGPLTRLIVLSYSDMRVALRVDRVERIGQLTGEVRATAAAAGGSGVVEGVCAEPDGPVLRLNATALIREIDRVFEN